MRLRVYSDLHIEFEEFHPPEPDCDLVVLAGDVAPRTEGIAWAARHYPDTPVIYVCGNHEFYGAAAPRLARELREMGGELGIHVLENQEFEIDGIVFLGCTLWTDMALLCAPAYARARLRGVMTDYRAIQMSPQMRLLRPKDTIQLHWNSRSWLKERLDHPAGRPVVVITHHAPRAHSLAPGEAKDLASAAYASKMDRFVANSGAELWIHGHTHHCNDYLIADTRVVSNARGYPDEQTGFDPDHFIEI